MLSESDNEATRPTFVRTRPELHEAENEAEAENFGLEARLASRPNTVYFTQLVVILCLDAVLVTSCVVSGQRDVTVADAAETARRTFLEVESAAAVAGRSASSSPHHCTPAPPPAAAGTTASHIGRDGELCDRVPSLPSQYLPSR